MHILLYYFVGQTHGPCIHGHKTNGKTLGRIKMLLTTEYCSEKNDVILGHFWWHFLIACAPLLKPLDCPTYDQVSEFKFRQSKPQCQVNLLSVQKTLHRYSTSICAKQNPFHSLCSQQNIILVKIYFIILVSFQISLLYSFWRYNTADKQHGMTALIAVSGDCLGSTTHLLALHTQMQSMETKLWKKLHHYAVRGGKNFILVHFWWHFLICIYINQLDWKIYMIWFQSLKFRQITNLCPMTLLSGLTTEQIEYKYLCKRKRCSFIVLTAKHYTGKNIFHILVSF